MLLIPLCLIIYLYYVPIIIILLMLVQWQINFIQSFYNIPTQVDRIPDLCVRFVGEYNWCIGAKLKFERVQNQQK
jgi:hypothetical protein